MVSIQENVICYSMSDCIEMEMSKIILALPTKYDDVEIFETVIGSFSCVNTRLAFDSQILLPNLTDKIDLENNAMNKHFNYKVVYNLKMNNEKTKKSIITKILKLDKNNQYGHGMTKPLPTSCIKECYFSAPKPTLCQCWRIKFTGSPGGCIGFLSLNHVK